MALSTTRDNVANNDTVCVMDATQRAFQSALSAALAITACLNFSYLGGGLFKFRFTSLLIQR